MIQPVESVEGSKTLTSEDMCYEIVAWGNKLPEFDPLKMLKTVVLSPQNVKKFNRTVIKFSNLLEQSIIVAVVLRFATFVVSAHVGRILAPIAAALHIFPIIVFASGMRVEYVKITVCTFDFGFSFVANTLWAMVLSSVLMDYRAVLVIMCWISFTNSLLQGTHLRNTAFMVGVTLGECLFYVMLMIWLTLDFVDEVHHYTLVTARGRTLSTKDVLANVVGTMTMLSLRNLYCRYQHLQQERYKSRSVMQALGYRCKIALAPVRAKPKAVFSTIVPLPASQQSTPNKHPPLQMRLATELGHYYPRDTVWPYVGELTPIPAWRLTVLYACGTTGGFFSVLSLFLSRNTYEGTFVAATGMTMSAVFCSVYTFCCQHQLLKRVLTSFHFLFLELQIVTAGICLMDMFAWQWVRVCGIASGMLLAHTTLIIDALTPIMKRRLHFKFWLVVNVISLFLLVLIILLLDVMILRNWDLKDRAFLDFAILDHRTEFHVAPFLLGRVVTVFVWSGRYIFVVLTRLDDNALILLRGNVEIDYEGWKKQVNVGPRI